MRVILESLPSRGLHGSPLIPMHTLYRLVVSAPESLWGRFPRGEPMRVLCTLPGLVLKCSTAQGRLGAQMLAGAYCAVASYTSRKQQLAALMCLYCAHASSSMQAAWPELS